MSGAGEGNRTLIASLEGWSFTTKLHPHTADFYQEIYIGQSLFRGIGFGGVTFTTSAAVLRTTLNEAWRYEFSAQM